MDRFIVEAKFLSDADDSGVVEGKAWDFTRADRVGDVIEPAAFKGLALPLPMLFGHDPNDPVGVWSEAHADDSGIVFKGRLLVDDVPRTREVHALVKAGAVRGLSVGFTTKKAAPRRGGGRVISALELHELSLVTIPCHPGARVTSAKSAVEALRVVEAINRAAAQFGGRA